jgi:regulator of cell morphogenesis and NO signaling
MKETLTPDILVADLAANHPATVAVFQRHQLNFCCGGKVSLSDACQLSGLDPSGLLAELDAAMSETPADTADWQSASLTELAAHIQAHYHQPLRDELPRLGELLARVVARHGASHADAILPLRDHFQRLAEAMLEQMRQEDDVLFPALVQLETTVDRTDVHQRDWLEQQLLTMELEHASANAALAAMRAVTRDYALPDGACPTFRGLYYGLEHLERDLHLHVHLENNILFPRAVGRLRTFIT